MAKHRIVLYKGANPGVRALIEVRLGVKTTTEPIGEGMWAVYFDAPEDVNLDFLRPDVLPPLSQE